MEQLTTQFPPLQRKPLRLRGVFGVAWHLYTRSFRSLFVLTLVMLTLPSLLLYGLQYLQLAKTLAFTMDGNFPPGDFFFGSINPFAAVIGLQTILFLCTLVFSFLISPAYMGACYLELDQCMDGRRGTVRQLFRFAVPIGFRQFYTTYLSQLLVSLGGALVLGLVFGVAFAGVVASTVVSSLAGNGAFRASMFIPIGILLLLFLCGCCAMYVFLALIYPVAVHENKRAFKAVGRAFSLTAKRFWRMFGVYLIVVFALFLVISAILAYPMYTIFSSTIAGTSSSKATLQMMLWVYLPTGLLSLFLQPYLMALYTALYVDASSRIEETPPSAATPATESAYGKASLPPYHAPVESVYAPPTPYARAPYAPSPAGETVPTPSDLQSDIASPTEPQPAGDEMPHEEQNDPYEPPNTLND